jgi:hypothetical protein
MATFDLINETDVATITITDMQGRKVYEQKATTSQNEMQLDVSPHWRKSSDLCPTIIQAALSQ